MPALRTYDLFISHAWTYGDEYYRLVDLLDRAPNFAWRNFSVPEDDPLHGGTDTQLRSAIRRQVRPVHAVLIVSGVYATHSNWMQEEIEMALDLDKPIIGVHPWGSRRSSAAVQRHADEMAVWSTVSIVDAIRRNAL